MNIKTTTTTKKRTEALRVAPCAPREKNTYFKALLLIISNTTMEPQNTSYDPAPAKKQTKTNKQKKLEHIRRFKEGGP